MNDEPCRRFFLQPHQTLHRRYEALRAYFLDGRTLAEIADCFGYRVSSLKSMVCRFRAACTDAGPPPFFFPTAADAPPAGGGRRTTTGLSDLTSPTPGS